MVSPGSSRSRPVSWRVFVRAAVREALVMAGRVRLSVAHLGETLYWLGNDAREATVRALRQAGWLDYASQGATITDPAAGPRTCSRSSTGGCRSSSCCRRSPAPHTRSTSAWTCSVISSRCARCSLPCTARSTQPARRTRRSSCSRRRVGSTTRWRLSAQLRAVLDRVPLDHRSARRVVRDTYDLLSRLHGGSAELHRALTEVGRQYLHLTAGVTAEQIVRALMRESRDELGAVGRGAPFPVLPPTTAGRYADGDRLGGTTSSH